MQRTTGTQSSWRDLPRRFEPQFELVLCPDNSIVHAVDDEDLIASLRGMRDVLVPGGCCYAAWAAPAMYGVPGQNRVLPERPQFTGNRADQNRELKFRLWQVRSCSVRQTYVRLREQPSAACRWSQRVASASVLRLSRERMRSCVVRAGFEPEQADVTMQPSTSVDLELDDAQKVVRLVDMLEDLDDVQKVYTNADFSDEVMAQL